MKRVTSCVLLFSLCLTLWSQEQSFFSLSVIPAVELPLPAGTERFTTGGGVNFDLDFRLPFFPLVSVCTDFNYSYLPIYSGDGCNFFYFGAGLGLHLLKAGKLTGKLYGTAGYYYGIIADNANRSGGNLYGAGGLQVGWAITPVIDLGLNAHYKYVLDGNGGTLLNGLSAGLSTSYKFTQTRQLKIEIIQIINIFPVLYKYYNANSIGNAVIRNEGAVPVENLEISFFISSYMDNPTVCPGPRVLAGGKEAEIDIYALLGENVLDITEATIVSGKVVVSYTQNSKPYTAEKTYSIRIQDRNAMTWDDDRKVAAYVTYKDPVVIDIAKSLARIVNNSGTVIDTNLGVAIALHESLRAYGITYVKDPTTPFIEFSQDKVAVDYIQFPRNTLQYKSGDCDDLSILYASLLQAVGIDTAFITIPGHIFMAFALASPPEEAVRLLADEKDIIVHEGRAWVPVEITSLTSPFVDAWKTGAAEWNESAAKNEAVIYPMAESWSVYEPVGYIGEQVNIPFITQEKIASVYSTEMNRFIDRELYAKTSEIEASKLDKFKQYNRLGIVYAQYGRNKEAKDYLNKALQLKEYFSSIVNLGNIYYLEEDYKSAMNTYNRALKLKPNYPVILLQFARIHNKLGDYKQAGDYYQKLKAESPETAARYAYLNAAGSDIGRAAESKEEIPWVEE